MTAPSSQGDAIVLIGHGSREESGNDEIRQFAREFAARWQPEHPDDTLHACFIEFDTVLTVDGLAQAAASRPRVIAVPLILNAAGHVKGDIPHALQHAAEQFPHTEFHCAPHLGAVPDILTILRRNLRQCMLRLNVPDPQTTGVILLGRGSSDPEANGEIAKMARWLWESAEHELVDIAFTGVTFPRLEKVVQRHVRLGMTQIIVLPYYLFTGVLIQRIDQQMVRLAEQYPHIRFAHSQHFGFAEEIHHLIAQRIEAARHNHPNGRTDWRALPTHGHEHHHHHHDPHHHHH